MELPFLDRHQELSRLRRLFKRTEGSLAVLYGRRRCGKSRLLLEALPARHATYFVADDREPALLRQSLASEIGRALPGFGLVTYPDWDALFQRWWREARAGSALALDEFQTLASASPEVPSLLQKHLDRGKASRKHVVLCGSSQRMMQGLVLDHSAPLFGRAVEIMEIGPLPAGWIETALQPGDASEAVQSYATWGGVPRYWELASDFDSRLEAVRALVLDPLGVLFREPDMLLLEDVRDPAQSASILQLIGGGCHRLSEIASRLGKPATSLVRPLQRLLDLGLVSRDRPFGTLERDAKRSLYRLKDPFLRFWFRFVAPNRSRLEARLVEPVLEAVERDFPHHVSQTWEHLARESVPRTELHGLRWNPAAPWWGPGTDRRPLEIDVVADSCDGQALLLGSVKWEEDTDLRCVLAELKAHAARLPIVGNRRVCLAAWTRRRRGRSPAGLAVMDPRATLDVLR